MPLSNRIFNFFISNVSYSLPAVTILPFLRSYSIKVKLLRFFAVIYIKFIAGISISVSVFLN